MLGRGVVRRACRLAEHTHGPRQPTAQRLGIDANEATHASWSLGVGVFCRPRNAMRRAKILILV